ncbi:mRNA-decapping enzyme-like protein [Acorus calamus]|uniref:mRNA-decapping enzyme-like protein n=1 Tax=Acorus calamus TaxID=4465 RepID=A0AAV9ED20_ACOCL|nr:mRNA-decapping enzyme-like protein [Acorus calamus]
MDDMENSDVTIPKVLFGSAMETDFRMKNIKPSGVRVSRVSPYRERDVTEREVDAESGPAEHESSESDGASADRPFVEEILITAAHVTLYEFSIDQTQWKFLIWVGFLSLAEPERRRGVSLRRQKVYELGMTGENERSQKKNKQKTHQTEI